MPLLPGDELEKPKKRYIPSTPLSSSEFEEYVIKRLDEMEEQLKYLRQDIDHLNNTRKPN